MVGNNAGADQIPTIISRRTTIPMSDSFTGWKNGYIYIYVSNESCMDVFFDNLVIHDDHYRLLEKAHHCLSD